VETNWERRNILKAGATGAAWSLLGAGSLAARAQGSEAPAIILKNGKVTTLDTEKQNASSEESSYVTGVDIVVDGGMKVW